MHVLIETFDYKRVYVVVVIVEIVVAMKQNENVKSNLLCGGVLSI